MTGWLPYDEDLVAQIAATMDLRTPNAAALAAAARAVAPGDGREAVCALATGVGKSYVSAALVEYLAERGVRNVLIVTPGTAVHEKTIGNFTPGHPRFVPGGSHVPAVVTGPGPPRDGLTLYVFTVQQLIRPGATVSRRLRAVDEWLGTGLYQRLAETDDLVVIADEHHVYREAARAFAAAVRDLSPRALIGFTATPDPADRDRVVFRYPLAAAIADGLVSVPVLVGADSPGWEERLRDACRLREAKEAAWHGWATAHGVPPVTPLIFVVCRVVDDATQVAEILAGLLPGDGRVLLVTSRSGDEALRALARVSEAGSPVRAVVAVDKLSSGWDVPNVGVLLALRALASETLTEQVLGRGLRLPYGRRVGVPAVDSIDVLTHESYRELLTRTEELRQAIAPGSAGRTARDADETTLTTGDAAPLLRISGYGRALATARAPLTAVGAPSDAEPERPPDPVPLPAARFSLAAVPDGEARTAGIQAARTSTAEPTSTGATSTARPTRTAGPIDTGDHRGRSPDMCDPQAVRPAGTQDPRAGQSSGIADARAGRRGTPGADGGPRDGEAARDLAGRLLALPLVEATRAEVAEADRLAAACLAGFRSAAGGDGARWDVTAAVAATDALAEVIAGAYRAARRR